MKKLITREQTVSSHSIIVRAIVATALVAAACPLQSAIIAWDALDADGASGDGVTWGDADNWIGGVLPSSGDTVSMASSALTMVGVHQIVGFNVTGGAGSTLTINGGGHLTSTAGSVAARYLDSFLINAGGRFTGLNGGRIRSPVTVTSGGLLDGFGDDIVSTVTLNGGVFAPIEDTAPGDIFIGTSGNLQLASGKLQLDVFADNSNDFVDVTSAGGVLDLVGTTGEIELILDGGYSPLVGDSFNLWDNTGGGAVSVLADASNVTISGLSVLWDTSQWTTQGILTVAAPPVPEPNTLGLFALAGLAAMRLRRRRHVKS